MINTKIDRRNLYMRLSKIDIITRIKPLLERGGYYLRPEDGVIAPRVPGLAWDTPWIHVKHDYDAHCHLYHSVFFDIMKFIPTFCRNCWKVVVRPRTVVELFDLYELQKELDRPGKCGAEPRVSVFGLYGGYFYNRSKAEGMECYKLVRKAVNEWLSPDVGVILKRYCSEFELELGPSNEMPMRLSPEEEEVERYIETNFERERYHTVQPEHVQAFVMRKWIHWAYQNNDPTYAEFTDGKPMFKSMVTYHDRKKLKRKEK